MNQDFKTLHLSENDILVVSFDMLEFAIDEIRDIYDKIKEIIPNNQVLIIPKGIELSTLSVDNIKNDDDLIRWKVD